MAEIRCCELALNIARRSLCKLMRIGMAVDCDRVSVRALKRSSDSVNEEIVS